MDVGCSGKADTSSGCKLHPPRTVIVTINKDFLIILFSQIDANPIESFLKFHNTAKKESTQCFPGNRGLQVGDIEVSGCGGFVLQIGPRLEVRDESKAGRGVLLIYDLQLTIFNLGPRLEVRPGSAAVMRSDLLLTG